MQQWLQNWSGGVIEGLVWKVKRLGAMGAGEVIHRIRRTAKQQLERVELIKPPTVPSPDLSVEGVRLFSDPDASRFDCKAYQAAADSVLSGRFSVFALADKQLGFPPNWMQDPLTGTLAPNKFGKSINYRDERQVGNIKYLWEINRHLELVPLAQAYALTQDDRYIDGIHALLSSWIAANPYAQGVNWSSALEVAIRLVNWSVAWQLVGGADSQLFMNEKGQQLLRSWLASIYCHCHFVFHNRSYHSSANNHLLGECMGLAIASLTWPHWNESRRWARDSCKEFEREALLQNTSDGVNREQAIWYHHEVTDMMVLTGLYARAAGRDFSAGYWDRCERMMEFIQALMDCGGNVPAIGDSDDAVMVRFYDGLDARVFRSLLGVGAILFDRADFATAAGGVDDKARWLFSAEAIGGCDKLFEIEARSTFEPKSAFPEGGYWVLGSNLGTPEEIRVVADAGPLGYLSLAAHGHADTLSFCLSAAGTPVLIDPGTFAYHTEKRWRDYFRGTSAHNTVRIDRTDQSTIGGNFLWTQRANASCLLFERTDDEDRWVAQHDGYMRLADPVSHRRELKLDKRSRKISVVDHLECSGVHFVELYFHFSHLAQLSVEGQKVVALMPTNRCTLSLLNPPLNIEVIEGQDEPALGWVSYRFDRKTPCPAVRMSGEIRGSARICSEVQIEFSAAPPMVLGRAVQVAPAGAE